MKFAAKLTALFALALATAISAGAQRGASSPGHFGGGTTLAVPGAGGAARSPSAARPSYLPAPVGVNQAHPPAAPVRPLSAPPAQPPNVWRFALENAPAALFGPALLRQNYALGPRIFTGTWFGLPQDRRRPFPHYPNFFFGGGPTACSPLLPGLFGSAWFDSQFTCFGTSFYGVYFYPPGFLAPQLAYEPWLEALPAESEGQMYGVGEGALIAGDLDMTAEIAARESAESNPAQQITMLVLKEGITIGVVDYWVDGNQLGYVSVYGRQVTIDLDRLDLQKTVDLNSSRGVPFVLRERATPPPPTAPQ